LIAVSGALGILALASATVVRTKPLIALTVFVFLSGLAAANQMRDAFFAKVCTVESDFFCIRIVDYTGMAARESRLMILDHMGHGINDRDDPALLHSSYVDLTDRVADLRFGGRDAIRTYFIGGGAYTLPRAWASKYPAGEHWVAELDPAVTRVAAERMWVNFGPSIRPVHRDARALLQSLSTEKRFDVIIGDAFRDIAIPHHLVTLEFNREIEARLAPNGFYALTVIDGWRDPKFLFAMVKTLREAFPVVEIWADADMMATSGRLTYLLLAGREPFAASELRSARFPERRWIRVSARSIPGRLSMDDVPVLTDDFAPVDRLIGAVASRSR
jgi:hypothetical protein